MRFDKTFLMKVTSPRRVIGWVRSRIAVKKMNHEINVKGSQVVKYLQRMMEDSGVFFYFDMGTLLGIIREGKLLSHDLDVDIAVFVDREKRRAFREYLISRGCVLKKVYSVEGLGVVEESFYYLGVKFDVNYYEQCENVDVCYLLYSMPEKQYEKNQLDVVKLTNPHVCGVKKVAFAGTMVNVPENPEEYLAVRYGKNWRIPDRKYIYWKGPSTTTTQLTGWKNIQG